MASCPHCQEVVRPVRDPTATPRGTGEGISGITWICPECDCILAISELDFLCENE